MLWFQVMGGPSLHAIKRKMCLGLANNNSFYYSSSFFLNMEFIDISLVENCNSDAHTVLLSKVQTFRNLNHALLSWHKLDVS